MTDQKAVDWSDAQQGTNPPAGQVVWLFHGTGCLDMAVWENGQWELALGWDRAVLSGPLCWKPLTFVVPEAPTRWHR